MIEYLIANWDAALQVNDSDKSDTLLEYCDSILSAMEILAFDNEFSRKEVLAANLSKLCSSDQEATDTINYYLGFRIKSEAVPLSNGFIGIYCTEDKIVDNKLFPKGKLLKNVNWREPVFNADNFSEWFKNKGILELFGYDV